MDSAIAEAELLAWNIHPSIPFPGANKAWPSVCHTCGNAVSPKVSVMRAGKQGGCVYCGRQKTPDDIRLARAMAADFTPTLPYVNNNAPWVGYCNKCGRPGYIRLNHIKQGFGACPYCSGNAIDPDIAHGKALAVDFIPAEACPGRHTPWHGSCARCGQRVTPHYSQIAVGIGVCRNCSKGGFNTGKPATFYVLRGPDGVTKGGVTNFEQLRLDKHSRQDVDQILHLVRFRGGHQAWEMERLWKAYIKAHPENHVQRSRMPDGFREAIHWHIGLDDFIHNLVCLGTEQLDPSGDARALRSTVREGES